MMSLAEAVPPLTMRAPLAPLWQNIVLDHLFEVEVMLTPTGAVKAIRCFKAFAREHGVTKDTLKAAYRAADAAALQQRAQGQLPFLVSAISGPRFSARIGFEVVTKPLGYHRGIITEMGRRLDSAGCRVYLGYRV